MVAAQNATQRSLVGSQQPQQPASATEESFSKDQIAKALGSKDPAWFRQTADRGQGSAAYRRNQVEDEDRLDVSSVKAQLPGMSAANATTKEPPLPQVDTSPPSHSALASPVTFKPPRLDRAADEKDKAEQDPSIPTGRGSPVRSPSPTKGLGGFVQSAMMKRSDSVKRWSVTSPPGLTRADSVAAARGSHDRTSTNSGSRPQSVARQSSTTPSSSRPTSQHGEKLQDQGGISKSSSKDSITVSDRGTERNEDAGIPTSPSKTMDSRRWSPTKSSWLESALNRPESPKPSPKPAAQSQPSWMSDLSKTKGESSRPTSYSHKHQVSIGGLMRQSALGNVAKPNTTGLGGIYSPPPNANRPAFGHGSKPSMPQKLSDPELAKSLAESPEDERLKLDTKSQPEPKLEAQPNQHEEQPAGKEKDARKPEKRQSVASPPPVKPKPQTPPKKDFRSTLRQRQPEKDAPKAGEPEFKNVFGNLRRTKTQNYVAPDELKSNILRGKAALSVTDGPKPSERKDEFKEAILKKRSDFKAAQAEGKGVARSATTAAPKPLPEGLAKRAELGKSVTVTKRAEASLSSAAAASTPKKPDSPKPTPGPKRVSSQTAFSPRSPNATQPPPRDPSNDKLRRVSTEPNAPKAKREPKIVPSLQKETSAPSKLQAQSKIGGGGGKLADRFNPALAGMLARGPPPPTGANSGRDADDSDKPSKPGFTDGVEPSASGPQLTHMTKNRARGPKRKAPKGVASSATVPSKDNSASQPPSTQVEAAVAKQEEQPRTNPPAAAQEPRKTKTSVSASKSNSHSVQQQAAAKAAVRSPSSPKPVGNPVEQSRTPNKETPRSLRGARPMPTGPRSTTPSSPAKSTQQADDSAALQPSSPKKLDMKRMSKFLDEAPAIDTKPEPVQETRRLGHQRTGSRSPTKFAEEPLEVASPPSPAKSDRDSLPSMRSPRVGSSMKSPPALKPKPSFDAPSNEPMTPRSQFGRSSRSMSGSSAEALKSPPALASPTRSPTKQSMEVSAMLADIFGPPQARQGLKVDPAHILESRPQIGDKVTSLGLQMFQILGDGKKVPVAPQNERVLFDQEMYVCAHNFVSGSGKKVFEVYFWAGDEVPESAVEDAQIFVQREARSLGGKPVKLHQGKETAEFLQALGGVIIVRRGSSNKYDSLAPSMLCGRRYLGQVAFDEVDFSASSLCAGFTYLIAKGGNCHMWKGKGSDVTEVSCARLVGMDLALTAELAEYEDGSEPAAFWDVFDDKSSKAHSADHWRLKPNYDKYCSRLFSSDADSRQQVSFFGGTPYMEAQVERRKPTLLICDV